MWSALSWTVGHKINLKTASELAELVHAGWGVTNRNVYLDLSLDACIDIFLLC